MRDPAASKTPLRHQPGHSSTCGGGTPSLSVLLVASGSVRRRESGSRGYCSYFSSWGWLYGFGLGPGSRRGWSGSRRGWSSSRGGERSGGERKEAQPPSGGTRGVHGSGLGSRGMRHERLRLPGWPRWIRPERGRGDGRKREKRALVPEMRSGGAEEQREQGGAARLAGTGLGRGEGGREEGAPSLPRGSGSSRGLQGGAEGQLTAHG